MSNLNKDIPEKDIHIKFSALLKVQVVIAVVALGVTILVLLQIGSLFEKKGELEKEIKQKEIKVEELEKVIAEKKTLIASLTPSARKGLGFKQGTDDQGLTIPGQSLSARDAANEIIQRSSADDQNRRKHITVQYFPKNLDKEVNIHIVIPSLQEFGFIVEKKEAVVTWKQTNAIWFGSRVKPEDVKLVAYTLISAGMKIRWIKPFQKSDPRKASLIQIGAISIIEGERDYVDSLSEIKVEDIRKTDIFSKD